MKDFMNKKGYTIAEIMIVLLILTIIFAAFAPLITKRRVTSNRSKYAVWKPVNVQREFNAYYDPGDSKYSGSLFVGITPDGHGAIKSSLLPISRLVIRSGAVTSASKLQRQIQFRFGRSGSADEKKFGKFAGTWLMDRQNVLLGGAYMNLQNVPNNIEARDNVAIGYQALTQIQTSTGNSALGAYSLAKNATGKYNVAVGYKTGYGITTGSNNTYIGSFAGENQRGSFNTAIGYNAMGTTSGSGELNTFIGAWAGDNTTTAQRNVGIGYKAMGSSSATTGNYNIAVGAHALENITSGSYNVAIGYKACMHVTSGSYKTCIGANSGPATSRNNMNASETTGTKADYIDGRTDNVQRTYIGSRPYNYGGDAVLEIHNVGGTNNKLINSPSVKSNTTTVINGNLIVRGRSYFTVGNELWNFGETNPKDLIGSSIVSGETLENAYGYYGDSPSSYRVNSSQTSYDFGRGVSLTSDDMASDRRLKNIGTRSLAGLNEINKLKIYNYTFKNDKNKLPHVGVMAQDLQKIFPNSVTQGDDGYLRIRWDEMFFAAINAIKELDKKIVALVNRTMKVETQIAQLEKENTTLKAQVAALNTRVQNLKNK